MNWRSRECWGGVLIRRAMEAKRYTIEEKLKVNPVGVASPRDFRVREEEEVDARRLLNSPNVSLYCLDFERRRALFVETPSGVDLNEAPFLYQAQYENAVGLIEISFETFHLLAEEVDVDPACIIFIYSIARCGSTLVSQAFGAVEGVESLSEPDVCTQMLCEWGVDHLEGVEKANLVRSSILFQCAPSRAKGATAFAIKFRSQIIEMGPLLHSLFPEAKVVFLYRKVEPWARSMFRMMGRDDPELPISLEPLRNVFGKSFRGTVDKAFATPLEILSLRRRATMEQSLKMTRLGIPQFIIRYEELMSSPQEAFAEMFEFCDLTGRNIENMDSILKKDSQAGSLLSRDNPEANTTRLTSEHMRKLHQLIAEISSEKEIDRLIPGSFTPHDKFGANRGALQRPPI